MCLQAHLHTHIHIPTQSYLASYRRLAATLSFCLPKWLYVAGILWGTILSDVNAVATELGSVIATYHQTAGISEHCNIYCFFVCLTYRSPNDCICFNFLPLKTDKSEKNLLHFLIYRIVLYWKINLNKSIAIEFILEIIFHLVTCISSYK